MTELHEVPAVGSWGSMRVMLAPGDLIVAREGLTVVVADARSPGQEAVTDRLLDLCASAANAVGEGTGASLVRSVAALLAGAEPDDVPSMGLATLDGERLLVTLTGAVRLAVTDPQGGVELVDATSSLLPVNRVVGLDEVASAALGLDPAELVPDRRSNLSGGVVRGGGLLLVPGAAPGSVEHRAAETLVDMAPPPDVATPSFTTFSLYDEPDEPDEPDAPDVPDLPDEPAQQAEPDEQRSPAAGHGVAHDAPQSGPTVQGIVCSRGHFNPPDARYCERCGISMVHQTHNLVSGTRPPLGVLVLDDGSVHSLVGDIVIGRDPGSAEEVRSGRSAALVIEDPDLSLSRVHARLVLDGWEVRVEDAGSANGTFVADAGSEEWRPLEVELPTTITPGSRVRLGSRVLTYESHHKS